MIMSRDTPVASNMDKGMTFSDEPASTITHFIITSMMIAVTYTAC